MIEYANEKVTKCKKQYDMLLKSLKYIPNTQEKTAIYYQMTKITEEILDYTNETYESQYNKLLESKAFLMEEEKDKLEAIINLINERKAYITNLIVNNREKTYLDIEYKEILGENKLDEFKKKLKIIEKYNSNIKDNITLNEEIKELSEKIIKAQNKIKNNEFINSQLELKMQKILKETFEKNNLYELKERTKEIDLAYTELGYSLEKAKENARLARNSNSEDIIIECDNMLSAITLEYERYKEKKLTLKLMEIYKKEVTNYDELLAKREIINNILLNIQSSELYKSVGQELNKQYNTIKLESQDLTTLESLIEEKENKKHMLEVIEEENESEEFKEVLKELLKNEKIHEQKLLEEKRRLEEKEKLRRLEEEQKKQQERIEQQKKLEEERNREIERRTKQLLEEKQKSILTTKEELNTKSKTPKAMPNIKENEKKPAFIPKTNKTNISPSRLNIENEQPKETKIPIIKNNNLNNEVIGNKKLDIPETPKKDSSYDIKKEVNNPKEDLFPEIPIIEDSFFNEEEMKDLNNYMESDKKSNWF